MTATRQIERTILIFLLILGVSRSIASAGDYASRSVIGFSPDGRHFAFEQYGIEDGSGFPYAEIFILDTAENRWVPGSPVRKRLEDEQLGLDEARRGAKAEAAPVLAKLNITEPGEHLASNPRAELSAPLRRTVVNAAHSSAPPSEDPVVFTLEEKPFISADCQRYSDLPVQGFTLTMQRAGESAVALQDDAELPSSRGCALGYAIADIFSHGSGGKTTYAVLLHVQTLGFEGPNSRFLAVTRRLP